MAHTEPALGSTAPVKAAPVKAALIRAALVLGVLGTAGGAQAADYYVSPLGSDGATGSLSAPFRTIARGAAVAMPGDTVIIRGGRYVGWQNQINPVRAGRADAWITFRAFEGELPVLLPPSDSAEASAFEPFNDPADAFADVPIAFIRVEGLVAYQWPTSGFSNGWEKHASNIEVRHCIADGSGINGLSFYEASGVTFEHNIAAHNGNRAPSYSSGVNLYRVSGGPGVNLVRGNVSFENVDICGDPNAHACDPSRSTDGNGFILDENGQGVRFESNLAFRNGGSCLRVTLTPGVQLINNTCYDNGLDTGYAFAFGEIYFSDAPSRNGIVVRNNLAVGTNGQAAINDSAGTNANVGNNALASLANVFRDPNGQHPDFRLSAAGRALLDAADGSATGPGDIGFDPGCVVRASTPIAGPSFWQYAVNYPYIQSIGGVAACFRPAARSVGGGADMGAYEAPALNGCQFASDCDDAQRCTRDVCGAAGQCSNEAIIGCCTSDAQCDDGDACTSESCDVASATCNVVALANCCSSDAECADSSACTTNTCSGVTHACETAPVAGCCAGPTDCDDGNVCTDDACDVATGDCSNPASPSCASGAVVSTVTGPSPPAEALDPAGASSGAGTGAVSAPGDLSPATGTESAGASAAGDGARASEGGGCALAAGVGSRSSAALGSLMLLVLLGAQRRNRRRPQRAAATSVALLGFGCASDGAGTSPAGTPAAPSFVGDGATPHDVPARGASAAPPPSATPSNGAPSTGESTPTPAAPASMGQVPSVSPAPATSPAPTAPAPPAGEGAPSGPARACDATLAPEDGLVVDFGTYDLSTGAWGDGARGQLTGGTSAYSCADTGGCPAAAALTTSFTPAGGLRLRSALPTGGYAGAVLWFGPCIDARRFEGLQFLANGELGGAVLLFKVQTHANYPVDVASAKGGCEYTHESSKWSECVPPAARIATLPLEPEVLDLAWSAFAGGLPSAAVTPEGLVGLELQLQCPSATPCAVDLTLGTLLFRSPPFSF